MSWGKTNPAENLRHFHLDLPGSETALRLLLISKYNLIEQATIIINVLRSRAFRQNYFKDPIYLKYPIGENEDNDFMRGEGLVVTTELGIFLQTIYTCIAKFENFESKYGYKMTGIHSWISESELSPVTLSYSTIQTRQVEVQGGKPLTRSFRKLKSSQVYD